ncbi:GDP-mannose transporter into the lumen of the Golgi [Phlyctochytrium planicorne]|nr:GDP-mannose transporter into the lumen of the Golgi [Phlyctochytrium planicorne]
MTRETWYNGPLAAIAAYCGASILMTVTNKAILSSYEFHMNFLVLAIQNALTIILLEVFINLNLLTAHRPFKMEEAKKWFVVSLALVVMIYTGSKALQYMSIPLFTIFKNLTIVVIAYSELWFFGGAKVTPLTLTSFLMMVGSSMIAGWADIYAGGALKKTAEVSVVVAYGWMILNCLTSAFFALIMRAKIKEVNFKDFDTVFYNNLLSLPVLLVCSFVLEQEEFTKSWDRFMGDGEDANQFSGLCWSLILSSISAFAISYASAWCVRVTSSTTYSMVGALNKLPIAIAGMIFFDDPVTFAGVCGVFIAFAAGILYTYSKNQSNKGPGYKVLPVSTQDTANGSKSDGTEMEIEEVKMDKMDKSNKQQD